MDILTETPERIRQLALDIFGEHPESHWLTMREIHQQNPGASKGEAVELLAMQEFGWIY